MDKYQTKPTPAFAQKVTLENAQEIANQIDASSLSITWVRNSNDVLTPSIQYWTGQWGPFTVTPGDWVVDSQAKGVYGISDAGFQDEYTKVVV